MPAAGTWLDAATITALATMLPVLGAAALWFAVPDIARRASAVPALLWNLIGLTAVNVLAVQVGWWSFGTTGGEWFGVPADLIIAWAVLWSLIPVLAGQWIAPRYAVVGLILLDIYLMPVLDPAVRLSPHWWWGEVVAVITCLLPGVLLGELTARRRRLRLRVCLQVVLFTAILLVAIPAVAATMSGRSAEAVLDQVGGPFDLALMQVAGVVALVAVAAVVEFARHGGTPYPWDAPDRLVTSGPYAYVRNPMQLCGTLLLVLLAVITGLPLLAGAALIAAAFSSGLAAYVENDSLATRFGGDWADYRRAVRPWWPRRHPVTYGEPARVHLARGCDPCSELTAWIVERSPVGLEVLPAEDHQDELRRMRYQSPTVVVDGVRAFGLVLTHLNLAWALAGWVIATPGISHVLQVLVDVSGGAPRDIARD
ncbi:methyltransferase family protein [Gordonia sp. DT218]|uniref:methyltransferase family protein n=1 Tax=Gordonia sp. DT218 TaxID=3416659 RepID=UPI003CFA8E22